MAESRQASPTSIRYYKLVETRRTVHFSCDLCDSWLKFAVVKSGSRTVYFSCDLCDSWLKFAVVKSGSYVETVPQKAAEANLILRREETAAMRSQANTAKLLADNPTLMRLRELEVLEKIASNRKMNIVLGKKGLADREMNLLQR